MWELEWTGLEPALTLFILIITRIITRLDSTLPKRKKFDSKF